VLDINPIQNLRKESKIHRARGKLGDFK
jgi:hypothetical protein